MKKYGLTIFIIFRVDFAPKIFWLIFLGSWARGSADGVKNRKIKFANLENPAVKVECPPTSKPALQSFAYII